MNKNIDSETTIKVVKVVSGYVVGAGASTIVKNIIASNTSLPEGKMQKVEMYFGAAVLGMMAKDASKTYMHGKVDSWVTSYRRVVEKIEAKAAEENAKPESETELPASE